MEPRLVTLIHQRGHARLGTVAQAEHLVGYVLASPLALEPAPGDQPPDLTCLGIAPLAVRPEMQRQGVGSALMTRIIERARDAGTDALFLLGNPGYYRRFGFRSTHIGNEYGATDAFMALELAAGCLGRVRATARYVGEFAETGI